MPELPEVETMRRGILAATGSRIERVEWPRCARRPITVTPTRAALSRRLRGRIIASIERVGKRVALHLDSGDWLVLEPRMTGLVLLADPPTTAHLRLRLVLSGGEVGEVMFWDRRGLGLVRLLHEEQFQTAYAGDRLGPDALTASLDELRTRLGSSRRAIKVALLDQRAVAGIGNFYASEILHAAGIAPQLACLQLSARQWQRLHVAVGEVLSAAILHEGSTLSDGTYRNALNQAGGYQNHHRVYDRAGEACVTCGRGSIERIVQAQRSTFYCRSCQRARRPK